MEDCIFCKIVKSEIPSSKIYEDDHFFAFLDIHPLVKGHVLLLPKSHIRWMHEADDEMISKIFILTKDLMNKIRTGLSCDYVQVSVVGEEVPHFHIHLVPRFFHDKLINWPTTTYESDKEKESYASRIKE